MRAGSDRHRDLFCEALIRTHDAFDATSLPWPPLDERQLAWLRGFPFLAVTLETERTAAAMLAEFAKSIEDPRVREAVELQGREEARHGRLIEAFTREYAIPCGDPAPKAVCPTRDAFVAFGYQESLETFLGYGAFGLARRQGLFPPELLAIFDKLLTDESRHIAFFANWLAWDRARNGNDGVMAEIRDTVCGFAGAAKNMARTFGDDPATGPWFTASNAHSITGDVTAVMILETCIAEHKRHTAHLDPRLKQPRFLPLAAEVVLAGLRRLPPRKAVAA